MDKNYSLSPKFVIGSYVGYPTLKIFRDGNNYDYEGGRSADDIVRVMEEHVCKAYLSRNKWQF